MDHQGQRRYRYVQNYSEELRLTFQKFSYGRLEITIGAFSDRGLVHVADYFGRYLKQEIGTAMAATFVSLLWHQEDPLRLAIITCNGMPYGVMISVTKLLTGTLWDYRYQWEVWQPSTTATDSGNVVVVDGGGMPTHAWITSLTSIAAHLGFTTFRVQNVPPPMAGFKYRSPNSRGPPSHVAFSGSQDLVSILWDHGEVEVLDLKMDYNNPRLVLNPTVVWSDRDTRARWRRLALLNPSDGDKGFVVALLGVRDGKDLLGLKFVQGTKCMKELTVDLPSPNGRLVETFKTPYLLWQSIDKEVNQSKSPLR
jgi:elongator complex protein 1